MKNNNFFELTSKLIDPLTVQVGDVWVFEGTNKATFFVLAVQDDLITVCQNQSNWNYLHHMLFKDFENKYMSLKFRDAKFPPYTYQFAIGLHSICPD